MRDQINRRQFLKNSAVAGSAFLTLPNILTFAATGNPSPLISPGCRTSKVKVARLYMGKPDNPYWPKPRLDLKKEIEFYKKQFAKLKNQLADVDFVVDQLVSSPKDIDAIESKLKKVDGIVVIHMTMLTGPILDRILKLQKPTAVFARPYSGHQWTRFGNLREQQAGKKMSCFLTSDYSQLAAAIRPFRGIHHLREAKILNLAERSFDDYAEKIKEKFGTEHKIITLKRVIDTYNSIDDKIAQKVTEQWVKNAVSVVEPSAEDVFKSCKLGLALRKLIDEENAIAITIDCYGTMYDPQKRTIKLPAYPCVGFSMLNNAGFGGICESDLQSALTHILYQGLVGKPGFINDPTMDESQNSIIMAHCTAATKMEGLDKPAAPYKLRDVMEREEGVVMHVKMRIGQKVTNARFIGTEVMRYFTGKIIGTPYIDRGCRTKINVEIDGDAAKLWNNWAGGLHRVTCYGDLTKELQQFCRFKDIELINEAV